MNTDQIVILVFVGAVLLVLLWLGFHLLMRAFRVALALFGWATAEHGFVGAAIYFACWAFMFPVMVAVCLIGALFWSSFSDEEGDEVGPNTPRNEDEARLWAEEDERHEQARRKHLPRY